LARAGSSLRQALPNAGTLDVGRTIVPHLLELCGPRELDVLAEEGDRVEVAWTRVPSKQRLGFRQRLLRFDDCSLPRRHGRVLAKRHRKKALLRRFSEDRDRIYVVCPRLVGRAPFCCEVPQHARRPSLDPSAPDEALHCQHFFEPSLCSFVESLLLLEEAQSN